VFFKTTFPLRYKVIAQYNNLSYQPIVIIDKDISSSVVAFPNRYMSNPASMFGHIFLILKSEQGLMASDIFHFIADARGNDSLSYVFNGLTGKFKCWFLLEPYYSKIKEYNHVEDRDVIYYDLGLTLDQIQNLQLHAVELKQSYFSYYFLKENCAFFIGKILNIVLDDPIDIDRKLVLPSQIINSLIEKSLLESEYIRTPVTKLFNESYSHLSKEEKSDVIELILVKSEEVPTNSETLKTFLYISEYMISNQTNLAQTIRHNRIQAYKELSKQRMSQVRPVMLKQEQVNHINSKKLNGGYGFNKTVFLSYHPIFYDIPSPLAELEVKRVNLFSPRVTFENGAPFQFDFTIADISNITPYNKVTSVYSWKLNSFIGVRSSVFSNHSFEYGGSYTLSDNQLMFAFIGGNLSSYDSLIEQELADFKLTPSLTFGIKQQLFYSKLKASFDYDYKFNNHYLSIKFNFKYLNLTHHVRYVISDNFVGTEIYSSYVF
jgi:hypothetical protein